MKRRWRVLLPAAIVVGMVTVVAVAVAKGGGPSVTKVKVGPRHVPIGGTPPSSSQPTASAATGSNDPTSPPAGRNTPDGSKFWTPDRMAQARPDPDGSVRSPGPSGPATPNPAPGQTAGGSPPTG